MTRTMDGRGPQWWKEIKEEEKDEIEVEKEEDAGRADKGSVLRVRRRPRVEVNFARVA